MLRALVVVGPLALAAAACADEQRWLEDVERNLTTDGTVMEFPLPTPASGPTTIAVAPDGSLWFTLGGANAIGRMNPDGSGLLEHLLPHPSSAPRIIALGADGNMWFSEHTGNRMGRITPSGAITEFDIPTPASQPRAIALGADGSIWFGMFAAGKIGRITPDGVITEFEIPTPDSGPRALAAGPDGNIWFSEFKASKVGRITPDGAIMEFPLPRPNSGPGDITAGADGAMWFVELSGQMDGIAPDGGRVGRITHDRRGQRVPHARRRPVAGQHRRRPRPKRLVYARRQARASDAGRYYHGVLDRLGQLACSWAFGRRRPAAARALDQQTLVCRRRRKPDRVLELRVRVSRVRWERR